MYQREIDPVFLEGIIHFSFLSAHTLVLERDRCSGPMCKRKTNNCKTTTLLRRRDALIPVVNDANSSSLFVVFPLSSLKTTEAVSLTVPPRTRT